MRHSLPIVGAKFRPPALGLLKVLPSGTTLVVRREPMNIYDANALMVLWPSGAWDRTPKTFQRLDAAVTDFGSSAHELIKERFWHLGYIPREDVVLLAPRFDRARRAEVHGTLEFNPVGQPRVAFEEPTVEYGE